MPLSRTSKILIGVSVGTVVFTGLVVGLYFALKPSNKAQLYGCSGDSTGTCILMDAKSGGTWKTMEECLCFKCSQADDKEKTIVVVPVTKKGEVGEATMDTKATDCKFKCGK